MERYKKTEDDSNAISPIVGEKMRIYAGHLVIIYVKYLSQTLQRKMRMTY